MAGEMDDRQLKTFVTAAREPNFTRAAAELGCAQSAVSAEIKALEQELGVALFDRLGRREDTDQSVTRLPLSHITSVGVHLYQKPGVFAGRFVTTS
jgi:Bacterial regulatory helix-turn-helix protein, lysR family